MKTFITEEKLLGFDAVRFGAGGYEAVIVPAVGANLVSLKNLEKNKSILRTPENISAEQFSERPQVYGIPVLFPPNRITDGTFTVDGKKYEFPITNPANNTFVHGFLHRRAWQISAKEAYEDKAVVEALFVCDENTDFYSQFPHSFEFRLKYTLSADGLLQEISIKNNSAEKMPIGLGFHTSFLADENYHVLASLDEKIIVEGMLPTGEIGGLTNEDKKFLDGTMKAVGHVLDNIHYTNKKMPLAGMNLNGAILTDSSDGAKIVYEWGEKFGFSVIWNEGGDKGYICPEPQSWAINAPNIDLPYEKTGVYLLAPNQTWSDYTKIYMA